MEELGNVAGRLDGTVPEARKQKEVRDESTVEEEAMQLFWDAATLSSIARIEAVLDEEKGSIQLRRLESLEATEPGLRSVLERIIETQSQMVAELESYLRELRSLNEITLQINEMFL
jgi:hypothetical protein